MAPGEEWLEQLWREGRWEELLGRANADLSAARLAQDPLKQSLAYSLLSSVHGAMGNWRESLQAARSALRTRREIGDALGIARALAGLSAAYAAGRGIREALFLFRMTNRAFSEVDEFAERCHAAAALGQILVTLDRTREARDVLDEAIGFCGADDLAWCRWMLLEIKCRACRADQDLDSAIQCMEEAFLLRQREGAVSSACLRAIADLYLDAGRAWEATEMYRIAMAHAREVRANEEFHRIAVRVCEITHPVDLQRSRLTSQGLKTPIWERSH